MPAYLIANVNVQDPATFEAYRCLEGSWNPMRLTVTDAIFVEGA